MNAVEPNITTAAAPSMEGLGDVFREYLAVTERLSATHVTLQREIARLRSELEAKDRELERRKRLATLGELAAGVAHEIRNPLGAIQLYSGLLRSQCGSSDAATALIDKIEAGIRAIDGVVQDTLALSPRGHRLAGQAVGSIVSAAVEACLPGLAARRIALDAQGLSQTDEVYADSSALQRVLINLLTNAGEASPPESCIELRVEAAVDGGVMIRVLDHGCGIPEEVLDRLFDPFFSTKAGGTGLGLAIAHRTVEAHGGHLTAVNRFGGGAEFRVWLPRHDNRHSSLLEQATARESSAA
jgi:signal transduction histidine kinase